MDARTPSDRSDGRQDLTDLLLAWRGGDATAFDTLVPMVHAELRRIARSHMSRERDSHTLQATALVNEAYLRLVDLERVQWHDRSHFFAMASRLMRRVLVDHARAHRYQKRGGGERALPIDEAAGIAVERDDDLVALDEGLEALAQVDARKAKVVELRYFGGLSLAETATILAVSVETVSRDWRLAKLWLLRYLAAGSQP